MESKTVNKSALARARKANIDSIAAEFANKLAAPSPNTPRLSGARKISTILGFPPSAEQLVEPEPHETVNKSALARAKKANRTEAQPEAQPTATETAAPEPQTTLEAITSVRKASQAVTSIGADRGGGVPEELMSELYCRNSWGLFWPTLFALKRFPDKNVYYLGYKDSEERQHIIACDQIRAVTVDDATLELTIVTDIATVGSLIVRVGSRVEFVRWVAAMHDKWVTDVAEAEQGKLVAPGR